jgi:hypothetical protein
MERSLFIGNHSTGGGVRAFLDWIDVISTYLPLFPPILNVTYQELTNQEKQVMLFDALPKDYIDQMKKGNQVPLEMPLEELRSYALNIEEAKVNKVKNARSTETKDISNNNNHPPYKKMEREMVKENSKKERKMVKDIIHLQFLMDKKNLCVPFVEILDTLKTPAEPKKGQRRIPHNSQKTKPRDEKRITLKRLNPMQL